MSGGGLEVRGLSVSYGKALALHDLDLDVKPGSIVTVIGANGAGKSTLLNAIMGVVPSSGRLALSGRSIERLDVESRVAAGVRLVPETRELFSTMSVEDNLLLGDYIGYSKAEHPRRLLGVYERFPRLHERRRQLAGTLSGGERQMLALGRALIADSEVLLLDEPSLGLAPRIVEEILGMISSLRGGRRSVLLVEQNAKAALDIADYAYVLENGRVVLQGTSASVAGDPGVMDSYLGATVD